MVSRELASRGIRRPSVLIENDYQSPAMHKEEFDGAIRHDGLVWSTYIHECLMSLAFVVAGLIVLA
jgi:cobyric acid synthase